MKKLLLVLLLLLPTAAYAQTSGVAYRMRGGLAASRPAACKATAPADLYYATDTDVLYVCSSANSWSILATASAGGPGTVTNVSVVTANGFSGSVATSTTTPAITINNPTALVATTSTTTPIAVLGTISAVTGSLQLANSASAFLTTIQAGNAAAARTYTWPTNFGTAGSVLTDAAGNGTLSWAAGGGGLTVGTTTVGSGTTTRILYDNAGVLGEYTLTGTGTVVAMATAPVFTTSITSPIFASAAADPADTNVIRLGNNELIAWEKAVAGTDWTLGVNASDQLVSSAPFVIGAGSAITSSGAGGALGTAAFTAASAYEVPLTFSTGLTRSTNTITVNTSQNVATLSNLTTNGLVTTSGGVGTLSVTAPGTGVLTALGVNVGSSGAFVTFGGALGSPSSVGTIPAFTLGGTVSGGGNQINNVIIGTVTPLAAFHTTLNTTAAYTTSSTITQTSASAIAFESGPNGGTNPVLRLVNSTASQADGISITGLAAGSGTTFTALSSGSNAGFTFTPKGTGVLLVNSAGASATPSLSISTAGNGFYANSANNIDMALSGGRAFSFQGGGFLYMLNNTATLFFGASNDTAIGRAAAGKLAVTIGTTDCSTVAWCADLTLKSIVASGTSPTVSSGTIGTGARNAAGFFTSTTTGAYSGALTFNGTTAPVGWACSASNNTTGNLIRQTASSTTTATFGGTTVNGDVISYVCTAY